MGRFQTCPYLPLSDPHHNYDGPQTGPEAASGARSSQFMSARFLSYGQIEADYSMTSALEIECATRKSLIASMTSLLLIRPFASAS